MKCSTFWENIKTISILDSENYKFILNTCHDTKKRAETRVGFAVIFSRLRRPIELNFHRFVILYRFCDTRSVGLGQYCLPKVPMALRRFYGFKWRFFRVDWLGIIISKSFRFMKNFAQIRGLLVLVPDISETVEKWAGHINSKTDNCWAQQSIMFLLKLIAKIDNLFCWYSAQGMTYIRRRAHSRCNLFHL